ncbi:MAG: hypothetical protein OXH70_01950 [Acidobacteria bacterium]|nr:hypothetical protein [Acidobacteriota bacterium]MCY3971608.1 hypothetical protein [Acidobacteriota bacterium]
MTRRRGTTFACLPVLTMVASGAFGQWYTDNELQRMKTRPLARAMLQVESEAARCSGVSLGRGYTDAVNVASDLGAAVTGDYSYRGYGNLVTGILDAVSAKKTVSCLDGAARNIAQVMSGVISDGTVGPRTRRAAEQVADCSRHYAKVTVAPGTLWRYTTSRTNKRLPGPIPPYQGDEGRLVSLKGLDACMDRAYENNKAAFIGTTDDDPVRDERTVMDVSVSVGVFGIAFPDREVDCIVDSDVDAMACRARKAIQDSYCGGPGNVLLVSSDVDEKAVPIVCE